MKRLPVWMFWGVAFWFVLGCGGGNSSSGPTPTPTNPYPAWRNTRGSVQSRNPNPLN